MKATKRALAAVAIAFLASAGCAEEVESAQAPNEVTDMVALPNPITHAVTFKGRDGVAFMSQNGRFILRGAIYDMWTGKVIDSMEGVKASMQSLDLAALNLEPKDVDPMYFGRGAQEVTLFVDPLCPYCGKIFDAMLQSPEIAETYKFTIYTVPFLGDASVKAVNALSCAKDRDAALMALLGKDQRWMKAHEGDAKGCDVQPVMNRTLLSQMIGITGVPYIIGAKGGIGRGAPENLLAFLQSN